MNWSTNIESKSFTRPYPKDNNLNCFGDYHTIRATLFRRVGEHEIIATEYRLIGTNPEAKAPIPNEEYKPAGDAYKSRVLTREEYLDCLENLFWSEQVEVKTVNACDIGVAPKFLSFEERFRDDIDRTNNTVVLRKDVYENILRDARGY